MEGEVPTEKTVPKFCSFSAETALQLEIEEASKKVDNVSRLISSDNSDAGEFRRPVERTSDYKRILDHGKSEQLPE